MNDEHQSEPIILPEQRQPPLVHPEHYCEHPGCKRWGSFGFGGSTKQRWYCGEHREDAEQSS